LFRVDERQINENSGWKLLIDSLWKSFELRFESILGRLRQHRDLIDREAISFDIVESSISRKRIEEDIEKRERERETTQLQATLGWLCVEDHLQEDDLARLSQRRYPDTCDWVMNVAQFKAWVVEQAKQPILWLWGIPGSGKLNTTSRNPTALGHRHDV